jgi:fucose 4-O-acetylase-like acetyltransferase
MSEFAATDGSRGRVKALRIVAGVLGVLVVLLVVPFAVASIVSAGADQTIHRFHNAAGSVSSLILAAALLVLAWRPSANGASMQLLIAAAVVSVIAGFLGGDLITGLYFIPAVAAAIVVALYPWRTEAWRAGTVRWSLLALAVVAAVPSVAYALTQGALQRNALAGDVHAEMHHYSGIAVTALAMPATLLVAVLGTRGWRLVAWIGGASFVLFGLSAVVYDGYVSAPAAGWGWAALACGLAAIAAVELEERRGGTVG